MSEVIIVAEFAFVANKSFVGNGNKPITVPARYYQGFKQNGFITESVHATVTFRDESLIRGKIHVGLRPGGKYYQITLTKCQNNIGINDIKIGTRLFVRVLKTTQEWLIEIH